tara:strand:- start:139 stop:546 length:408 start_codon:yes stop_codon:yes gene_type:complete
MSKVSKEDLKRLQELAGIYTDLFEKDAGSTDNEKVAVGHVDNERDMIRRQLYQMGKYTVELFKMLSDMPDSDFPNWWQAKITKAGVYISDAKHYLENSLAVPPGGDMTGDGTQGTSKVVDPDFERDDVQDPSGVS